MKRRLLLSSAFAAFVALILPLQTFLGNRGDFTFSAWRLVAEQAVAGLLLAALVFGLLCVSRRLPRDPAPALLAAALACAWLESSVLSAGLPAIDGEMPAELGDFSRRVWDGVALAAVFVFVAAAGLRRPSVPHVLSLAVCAMGLAALVDARPSGGAAASRSAPDGGDGGLAITSEIVRTLSYSPSRNVLLFVLDTLPGSVASELVDADPALAARFPGFVAYRGNVGMHDCTKRGVTALMTGRYYEPGESTAAYMMSVLGTNSVLQTYRDGGWSIACMCDVLSYGYTTAPVRRHEPRVPSARPAVATPSAEVPYMSLLDVAAYRACPFAFKEKFLFQKLHSRKTLENAVANFVNEHVMFPALAEKPVADDPRPFFGKFHTFGAHMPLMFDLDGRPVAGRRRGVQDQRQAVSNALVHVARLLDVYRARGIYDRSLIVLTTDHGSKLTPCAPGAHPQASALLWVKPEGARAPFEESALPTGHARIAPLLRRAAEGPLTREACEAVLASDRRLFRYVDRKDESIVYDWIFRPDGTFEAPRNGFPKR